jgi:hypothetical protein
MSSLASADAAAQSDDLRNIFQALRSKAAPVRLQGAQDLHRYVRARCGNGGRLGVLIHLC